MKKNNYEITENVSTPDSCQVRDALLIIGGKWKSMILHALVINKEPIRFGALKSIIPEISQKMLTQQLREMERDGLAKRVAYPEIPPRVEYSITELGMSVGAIYEKIYRWQQDNYSKIEECRKQYDELNF